MMTAIPGEISNFFLAMQAGRPAAARMESLFSEDATYEEPFSGQATTHTGRRAILDAMSAGWSQPLPEMHIAIDKVETAGSIVRVDWTCYSPALPGGAGRGRNEFELRDGKIARLKTSFS
jgi:hypothetical protein